MRILVCDTSNSTCCAGVYEDGKELAYEISLEKKTHSETFMPLVMRVVKQAGLTLQDIDVLASTIGPGSYTGIRIGLSAVKGMALALGVNVIPVSSLKALAMSVDSVISEPKNTILVPCFDARNDRVFGAALAGDTYENLIEDGAYSNEEFSDLLKNIADITNKQIIVIGDGAPVLQKVLDWAPNTQYANGCVILPKGVYGASNGTEAIDGATITASYCSGTRADKYSNK
ncbi:MAG: tRNA (adenosine(37)-N6)-threonylcarbamoyltransferase complex dimerization subunit type 1 TsaB [Saccharofermentans sp.]|nr:tRNA (adenosine(37)-N6)-threonylcarbamoyltransferase complex dimerization subunit type 1 TsaB [Saccharofermentans sp.]